MATTMDEYRVFPPLPNVAILALKLRQQILESIPASALKQLILQGIRPDPHKDATDLKIEDHPDPMYKGLCFHIRWSDEYFTELAKTWFEEMVIETGPDLKHLTNPI